MIVLIVLSSLVVVSYAQKERQEPAKIGDQVKIESIRGRATNREIESSEMLNASIVGDPSTVKELLQALVETTQANEVIIHTTIYDHAARLRSYEIAADVWRG